MEMIPDDLSGVDTDLARRVIAYARSIAPCLDSLDGEDKNTAIAILKGVAADAQPRGSRLVASQRTADSSVTYRDVGSWFTSDDRAALRAMCTASASGPLPLGSFPQPSRRMHDLFPEPPYTS